MNKRILAVIGAAAAALATTTAIALAGWCWSDPVIGVTAGSVEKDFAVDIAVPDGYINRVDTVPIRVRVPSNVTARVKFQDNILPEVVTIDRNLDPWVAGQPVRIVVSMRVESGRDFPVMWQISWTDSNGSQKAIVRQTESDEWDWASFELPVK